jgi:hypothetical protein
VDRHFPSAGPLVRIDTGYYEPKAEFVKELKIIWFASIMG